MVKVDKTYVFDDADGPEDAGRALRRQEPADDLPLHDGTRLGGGLPELLVPRRQHRRQRRAPRASRRHSDGGLARAARQHRGVPAAHGLEVRHGPPRSAATSTATTACPSPRTSSPAGDALYNFEPIRYPLDEAPGLSVFLKTDSGDVFHTYSTYARGGEALIGTYHYLDFAPKGRDEDGLAFTMAWLRHHDRYDENYEVDPKRSYETPARLKPGESTGACCAHTSRQAEWRLLPAFTAKAPSVRSQRSFRARQRLAKKPDADSGLASICEIASS